ncbi:MAG: CoA transferase [Dehalococcoidia bacterium]|nr:CoA transferase [Dehalococcoidia bacterium]
MTTLPLEGYRVIDFGTAWAGPQVAQILSDFGAEVIKIESRARMDGLRMGRPIVSDKVAAGDQGQEPELQPLFHALNRGKLSVTLDYKNPKGRELLLKLAARSDVATENYSPGVLDRAGLGYDDLKKVKRDIVMLSLSAAGATGPLSDVVAYAPTMMALGGMMGLTGYENERVLMPWSGYGDANAALHGVFAIMAALRYRNQTGKGQHIDLSEVDACASLLAYPIMDYVMNGRVTQPQGNRSVLMAPHNIYRCLGDDAWVAIAVATDAEFRSLCGVMGRPELAKDPRFGDTYLRIKNRAMLDDAVAAWTNGREPRDAADTLQAAGVAAEPVMNIQDNYFDPHLQERKSFVEIEHSVIGAITLPAVPWRLSETPGRIRRPAPTLGQHNEHVCREVLGLSADEFQALEREKVFG